MSQPRAKYIVVRHPDFPGLEVPIQFSEALPHKVAAGSLQVVGAGFCSVDRHEAHAWGRSEGLGIESRGEIDARLLARAFCATVGTRPEPAAVGLEVAAAGGAHP